METKDYQWSIKLDNGEIYVIHADTWDELRTRKEKAYKDIMGVTPKDIEVQNELVDELNKKYEGKTLEEIPETDESMCDVHGVKMKEREGKNGKFYSHSRGVYPDLDWCSGLGYKSEL